MRPRLKRIDSPDIDPTIRDIADFQPEDPTLFGLLLQLYVGTGDGDGADSFGLVVCTARWLENEARAGWPINLRHHLLVERFDWPRILAFIEGYLNSISGTSWQEVAEKVSRLGHWEFEDYTEDRD